MIETPMYTREMALAMRKVRKPFPFTVDVAQGETQLNLLWYADEVEKWTDQQRSDAGEYLILVAKLLETYDVQVNIQGVPGAPRRV